MKLLFILLGTLSLIVGIIGIFLPVLPNPLLSPLFPKDFLSPLPKLLLSLLLE